MDEYTPPPMSRTDPTAALRALGDANRLSVARLLVEGAFNVGEVQAVLGIGQSTASHHLKVLSDAGLLECRKEGRLGWYGWPSVLPAPLEALRVFVRDHAPELPADARRRLHRVFEERAERTRTFFAGPAGPAAASERATLLGPDVTPLVVEALPAGGVVVDLGTGAGRLLPALGARAERVIGIDASPRMLEAAGRMTHDALSGSVELRLGALEHLPLADAEADAAVAHQVLHHAARPEAALAEARRALKPGGVLVVADFLPHQHEWMREELADQWLGFAPSAVERMLAAAGFTDVSVRRVPARKGALGMFVARAVRAPAVRAVAPAAAGTLGVRKNTRSVKTARSAAPSAPRGAKR